MADLCQSGCGRNVAGGFRTCCKSCAYLKKEKGFCGHDIACDIRENEATCPPWYWRSAAAWPENFHEEVGGEYVKQMGTKIMQKRLSDAEVVRCERVEDAKLWELYTARRAQIRERGALVVEDVKPETSQSIAYSASTTLDHGVNEVWLLHGTSEECAKLISTSNFRGSSGGCFGSGVYFADDAQKSGQYATGRTADGCKVMLLCRVVLGNIKALPNGQDREADRFAKDPNVDCVVGCADGRSREFVVFDASQVYPEYVMYYKSVG